MGKCPKRHDEYFKKMYEKDPNKEMYQHRYEEELMGKCKYDRSRRDGKNYIAAG